MFAIYAALGAVLIVLCGVVYSQEKEQKTPHQI